MLRDLGLLDADVAGAGQGYPRSRLLLMRRCTRSVGITPLLIGCSATDRVYCDGSGAALHGRALLDADVCSLSEETRVQACRR